jgi:CBS domain-containing protein
MRVREIMTQNPSCCTPEATVREAAQLMQASDCGCIPVVEEAGSNRLAGIITDRDIAVRVVAAGKGPDTRVREVMSSEPTGCAEDDDVREVERVMVERQVRRVPVVDRSGSCIGIVAQADLARHEAEIGEIEVSRVIERISEPAPPSRGAGAREARARGARTGGETAPEQRF